MAWDLSRAGLDLWDVVADLVSDRPRRSPGYVLALLGWIPEDGATIASMRGGRHWLGWTRAVDVVADTWDLHAAVAVAGGKKKPPTYPRPVRPRPTRRAKSLSVLPGAVDVRRFTAAPPELTDPEE